MMTVDSANSTEKPDAGRTADLSAGSIQASDIVCSDAGRDRGKLFAVLAVDAADRSFLLLADGKTRKVERPKRKKRRHVHFVARSADVANTGDAGYASDAAEAWTRLAGAIRSGGKITNSELRRGLAIYRETSGPAGSGGITLGKGRYD